MRGGSAPSPWAARVAQTDSSPSISPARGRAAKSESIQKPCAAREGRPRGSRRLWPVVELSKLWDSVQHASGQNLPSQLTQIPSARLAGRELASPEVGTARLRQGCDGAHLLAHLLKLACLRKPATWVQVLARAWPRGKDLKLHVLRSFGPTA